MADPAPQEVTRDTLLGGRIAFQQPANGYRAAIDPVLLAAAVPDRVQGQVADLGCGAGAAMLCLAARLPHVRIVGVEREPGLAALARQNIAANGFHSRITVVEADVSQLPRTLEPGIFDAVISNPPYLEPDRANRTTSRDKLIATVEGTADLPTWIDAGLRLLRPRGVIVMIQRADRLADLLAALGGRAGEIVVYPLWPKAGMPAKRIIVRARKGLKSPLVVAPGLVLHPPDGTYTAAAEAVLRGGAGLG